MARFSDNPLKSPLSGNECIAATDTDTGDDCGITPDTLVQFTHDTMNIANGSSQGLMSAAQAAKLDGIPSGSSGESTVDQLRQMMIPVFIGTVVDGATEILLNVLDNPIVLASAAFALSAGSSTLAVTIDGTPVTGMSAIALTTVPGTATATAARTIAPGSILGLAFTSSTGSPTNLRLTFKGNLTLV